MQTSDHWTLPILGSISCFNCSFNWTTVSNWWFCSAGNQMKKHSWKSTDEINEHFIISKFEFISNIYLYLGSSFLIGSEVVFPVVFFFLSIFLWDLPFRSLRNDSLKDFLRDFLRDIGLSSALAISGKWKQGFFIFRL